ncbi:phage tail protein [Serratia sp. Ag1]|uniref:phage tail protein n=1 Tax=Serratia sp. Ag1 TaxID=1524467 RepID=UPI000500FFEB|nr:phage tail protein [Serratia sp. Ag1]KFK98134.1 minor tail family protein [Serratia sp. Ag1]
MAIKTFTFPARVNATGDVQFRLRKAQFGDGYSQVAGDGINPVTRSWEVSFAGKLKKIMPVIQFLEEHQGTKSFQWVPPLGDLGLYRCDGFKPVALGAGNYSLTATFTEAFNP